MGKNKKKSKAQATKTEAEKLKPIETAEEPKPKVERVDSTRALQDVDEEDRTITKIANIPKSCIAEK